MRIPRSAALGVALFLVTLPLVGCDGPDATGPAIPAQPTTIASQPAECVLPMSDEDTRAELEALLDAVDALETAGSLNHGQATALRRKLENALRKIDEGMYCPAVAMLDAFREQVGSFIDEGILTPAEGDPLLDGVDQVLEGTPPVVVQSMVVVGTLSTCGLRESGRAYCWGDNSSGALGDGTTTESRTPVAVSGGHLFAQITVGGNAGGGFACGVDLEGAAYCWGNNYNAQLGDGTNTDRYVPTAVMGGHRWEKLDAAFNAVCGIATDGVTYCWGRNVVGQVGDGTTEERSEPTAVSGGHTFVDIATGAFAACGLEANGTAYCWGGNGVGQLGDGTNTSSPVPVAVSGGLTFADLAPGGGLTCGVESPGGAAYCWGFNSVGQLGDGTTDNQNAPTPVLGSNSFESISASFASGGHVCALRPDGAAYCWGDNSDGQLGDGTTTFGVGPVPVSGGLAFQFLEAGALGTCGIAAGQAYCWGDNYHGQVGDGSSTIRILAPSPVSGWALLP